VTRPLGLTRRDLLLITFMLLPMTTAGPLRIACLGDSNTEGIALADAATDAWPTVRAG